MNSDEKLVDVVGSTISKVVLYIAAAVVCGFWIDSCRLDEQTLITCEESCKGYGTSMESVTTRECVCSDPVSIETKSDVWVLPKK